MKKDSLQPSRKSCFTSPWYSYCQVWKSAIPRSSGLIFDFEYIFLNFSTNELRKSRLIQSLVCKRYTFIN